MDEPICTVLHVDYHCLYSIFVFLLLFGCFFCLFVFLLPVGMGKAFVCVLGGGVKKNYPKLFNVLLFFSPLL